MVVEEVIASSLEADILYVVFEVLKTIHWLSTERVGECVSFNLARKREYFSKLNFLLKKLVMKQVYTIKFSMFKWLAMMFSSMRSDLNPPGISPLKSTSIFVLEPT